MEAVSMQHLFGSNGKVNIFGWILFLGTVAFLVYSIWNCIVQMKKIRKEEGWQMKKIIELELNLRELRGYQYKESKA